MLDTVVAQAQSSSIHPDVQSFISTLPADVQNSSAVQNLINSGAAPQAIISQLQGVPEVQAYFSGASAAAAPAAAAQTSTSTTALDDVASLLATTQLSLNAANEKLEALRHPESAVQAAQPTDTVPAPAPDGNVAIAAPTIVQPVHEAGVNAEAPIVTTAIASAGTEAAPVVAHVETPAVLAPVVDIATKQVLPADVVEGRVAEQTAVPVAAAFGIEPKDPVEPKRITATAIAQEERNGAALAVAS